MSRESGGGPADPERYRRLRVLFDEACELPPADRGRFLEERCGDDPSLLEALRRMLADDEAHGPSDGALPEIGAALEAAAESLDGEVFEVPRYSILRTIGEGGFGVVYAAEQLQPVRRAVALKVIRFGSHSPSTRSRFAIECQALARLDHPAIARVFDAGSTPSGHLFCAMELVEGEDLVAHANHHALPIARRIELLIACCEAVQHAHQRGILHRDLKPSNILVSEVDGRVTPKIIDFGIAKVFDGADADLEGVTLRGDFLGTPAYMSPEQVESPEGGVDTRSDVYSLGVLLFELLTGSTPMDLQGLSLSSLQAALQRVHREDAPFASRHVRDSGEAGDAHAARCGLQREALARLLQGDLDRVLARALESDPAQRYDSPREFGADLGRFLAAEPVLARSPTTTYLLRKFAHRHRGKLALGVAALALLLVSGVAVVAALFRSLEAQEGEAAQRRVAEREARRAREEASISREIEAFLNDDLLAAVAPDRLGIDVSLREALDAAAEQLGDRFAEIPAVEVALRTTLGASYMALGILEPAGHQLDRACDLARRHLLPSDPRWLRAHRELGAVRYRSGRNAEAGELLREVLSRSLAVSGERDADTIAAAFHLAAVCGESEDQTEARELVDHWLPLSEEVLGPSHPQTIHFLIGLSHVLRATDEFEEAVRVLEDTSARARSVLGPAHRLTLMVTAQLASLRAASGAVEEAERLYRGAGADAAVRLGGRHPLTLNIRTSLWRLLSSRADGADEAARLLDELVGLWPSALPAGHPLLVRFQRVAARSFARRGLDERAIGLLRQVVAELEGEPSELLLQSMEQLAAVLEVGGGGDEAALWRARCEVLTAKLHELRRDH